MRGTSVDGATGGHGLTDRFLPTALAARTFCVVTTGIRAIAFNGGRSDASEAQRGCAIARVATRRTERPLRDAHPGFVDVARANADGARSLRAGCSRECAVRRCAWCASVFMALAAEAAGWGHEWAG